MNEKKRAILKSISRPPSIILFFLDNFKEKPFLEVVGFDLLPFFVIKIAIHGAKIQIYL